MTVVAPIHSAQDLLTWLEQVATWLSDIHHQNTSSEQYLWTTIHSLPRLITN